MLARLQNTELLPLRLSVHKLSQADHDNANVSIYAAEVDNPRRINYKSIGDGLFSVHGFKPGQCVAAFVQGAMIEFKHWPSYCEAYELPHEWAGFKAQRNVGGKRRSTCSVTLYDQSWRGMAHHDRPKWSFLNHDDDPNCEAVVPKKGGYGVRFVTTREVQPGEELTIAYHGDSDFGEDSGGEEPPPDSNLSKRKRPPAGAYYERAC